MLKRLKNSWIELCVLLGGYGLMGWLIAANGASTRVWFMLEAMTLYLAWSGTGAIAIAIVVATSIAWIETIAIACPEGMWWIGIPLTGAQVWAAALALSWFLAIALIYRLAFTSRNLNDTGLSKSQTFWLLVLVANVGLRIGQLTDQ